MLTIWLIGSIVALAITIVVTRRANLTLVPVAATLMALAWPAFLVTIFVTSICFMLRPRDEAK